MELLKKRKRVPDPDTFARGRVYDYSTPENRVATAEWLFQQAKDEKSAIENAWLRWNDYYNFCHDAAAEVKKAYEEQGIGWAPACIPDPFVMVESQIMPDVPAPEFHGRDNDEDSTKAKQRQFAVKYVVEENRLNDMNTANERRLRKLGDAFWKAYWDKDMVCGSQQGNIRVVDVPPTDIYPDPTAMSLEDCEYVAYVYTVHKLKFWRTWHEALEKQGKGLDEVQNNTYRAADDLLKPYTDAGANTRDDMVQVLELWFRQPCDTKDAEAGDVACTIQAGGVELAYIPRYWQETGRQCKLFPFVHYWCIRDETQFWNKSELEPILTMVDAADRELAMGLLNDALMSNDVILEEEGALAPGSEITNCPGSVVKVRQGRIGSVSRLGGLQSGVKALNMVDWIMGQIQRTNRNYDTSNGQETARVTTASGILQLRADANAQSKLKQADRDSGFRRLYELLDWLCLEFFDEDRMLYLGAEDQSDTAQKMLYNGRSFRVVSPQITDMETGAVIEQETAYYPTVDVTVTTGNGLGKNPAATVTVLDKLAQVAVTADNWQILAAELEYLDIPQKQEIVEGWRQKFQPAIPPEITAALEKDPELLEAVATAVQMGSGGEMQETQPVEQMPMTGGAPGMSAANVMLGAAAMDERNTGMENVPI